MSCCEKGASKLRQAGMGLLEVIMAAGIGIMGVMYLTTGVTNIKKAGSNVEADLDLSAIRKTIIESLDCRQTFAGKTHGNVCGSGSYIDLLDRSGTVLSG